MTHSLRANLVLRTALLLAATMAVAALAIYLLMRSSLVAEFDAALLQEARSLTPHVELSGEDVGLEFELGQLPEYSRSTSPHYFQIWNHEGEVQGKSVSLGTAALDGPADERSEVEFRSVTLPSGLAGRQIALRFQPRIEDEEPNYRAGGKEMVIVVARDTADLVATLATLAGLLTLVSLATVTASIVLLRGVIGRGLSSLNALTKEIENVGLHNLAERAQLQDAPAEMVPVVQRLNDLLGRLEQTVAREKAFTAEVAHELRTPLAGLQTALEVCASRPREAAEYQRNLRQCLQVANQMHAMVQHLLMLARADARQLIIEREPVDVGELLRECWAPLAQAAESKSLEVNWRVESECIVGLDREKTRLVLRNLLENAVAHSQPASSVRVACHRDARCCRITIANPSDQLRPDDIERIFDRFWRADVARKDASLHCGLGLALCQRVVDALGGTIEASLHEGQFSISVTFECPSDHAPRLPSPANDRARFAEQVSL